MKKLKKSTVSTIILILIFLTGLSLLLYPTVSDYWNSKHQSRAITSYNQQVADIDNDTYEILWQEAQAYNQTLSNGSGRFILTEEEVEKYESMLSVSGTNVIGYIEIPTIDCNLPIYHGTDDEVLERGVGHIEGSSLPVGGSGTHCVLSGHRGLPSAKLFTNLDQLTEGDIFILSVLDETLTYEVDQILIVDPYDLNALKLDPEQDYCTLITCTPYGVNSHRLLVRGHRVENQKEIKNVRVAADAMQIEPTTVAPLVAVPILLLLLMIMMVGSRKK